MRTTLPEEYQILHHTPSDPLLSLPPLQGTPQTSYLSESSPKTDGENEHQSIRLIVAENTNHPIPYQGGKKQQ